MNYLTRYELKAGNAVRLFIVATSLSATLLTGCGGGGGGGDSSDAGAIIEQQQRRITDLETKLADVQQKNGRLSIATWVVISSAVVLFAIGVAVGVKVKREIISLKDTNRVDSSD